MIRFQENTEQTDGQTNKSLNGHNFTGHLRLRPGFSKWLLCYNNNPTRHNISNYHDLFRRSLTSYFGEHKKMMCGILIKRLLKRV